jgi:phosphate transport system permease protein
MKYRANRMFRSNSFSHKLSGVFEGLTRIIAVSVVLLLLAIFLSMFWQARAAIASFGINFLTVTDWNPQKGSFGILPQIYGTLISSIFALAIALPVGIAVAILLSEEWRNFPKFLQNGLIYLVELLAAIPSVVYGLWGVFVLVPWLRNLITQFVPSLSNSFSDRGMLPAVLILALMILPGIASLSRDALLAIPTDLRLAAMGLGATRWESILGVQLPAANAGLIGAILLSWGRAMGETMAVTMLIGNSNRLSSSIVDSIFAPATTIASLLANQYNESSGLQSSALMYGALVLFVITLIVNGLAEIIIRKNS